MAKDLRKYGLAEKPNWFPGIRLKSANHKSLAWSWLTQYPQIGFDCRVKDAHS